MIFDEYLFCGYIIWADILDTRKDVIMQKLILAANDDRFKTKPYLQEF